MLRKSMIVLAMAAALTGGLTADAFARGGGGHMGGFGGSHMGGFGGGRGFAGSHVAGTRDHFGHDRRFGRSRFGSGWGGYNDYGCGYSYPYYNPYSCSYSY
jgi:hypothetical protein